MSKVKVEKEEVGLSQTEAYRVARLLKDNGVELEGGWVAIHKQKPSEIAEEYGVSIEAVLKACRRNE